MDVIRFRHRPRNDFYAEIARRVSAHFRDTGKSRHADRLLWTKAVAFGGLAAGAYALIVWHPFPPWVLAPVALVYGVATLLLAINVGHDAAHGTLVRSRWVNALIQFGCFSLVGVNAYLWRMRHTRSHHIFPNVNGCDIDIDENPFLRLSPNQPWRPQFRFQHLYAPLAYVFVALHTVLFQDFVYLAKRELANMRDIRHPWYEYVLFVVSKAIYFGLTLAIPLAVLPLPWWQVALGYLAMSAGASLTFVFLLIGTHFSDRTDFPTTDADGNLDRTWAEHNLATACDWAPESFWAHFFVGGVNAHAAHHLFPRVCHTHYLALARIIIAVTDEYGVAYNRGDFFEMVRSHFAFLRQMGRKPADAPTAEAAAASVRGANSPEQPTECRPAGPRSVRKRPSGVALLVLFGVLVSGCAHASGREPLVLKGHQGPVYAAEFSADGKRVFTYEGAGDVRLWDTDTGKELAVFRHPPAKAGPFNDEGLTHARLSPDVRRVVTVTSSRYARDWDSAPGRGGGSGGTDPRNDAARLWDTDTGKVLAEWICDAKEIAVTNTAGPIFSPDGRLLAVTFGSEIDRTVHVRDTGTGKALFRLEGHTYPVVAVAFSADGKQIATASLDQTARVWDTATGKCIRTLKGHTSVVTGVAFSPDGRRLVTTSGGISHRFELKPNGSSGGSGSADEVIARVWDVETGKESLTLAWGPLPGTPVKRGLNLGPLGLQIETTGLGVKGFVRTARFSPDGKSILTAGVVGDVWGDDQRHPMTWDAVTGKRLVAFKGETFGDVVSTVFSPDGKFVAAAGREGAVRVWDAATGKELLVLRGHTKPVRALTFDRAGTRLLTASDDGTARVWDIRGKP